MTCYLNSSVTWVIIQLLQGLIAIEEVSSVASSGGGGGSSNGGGGGGM